MPIPKYTSNFIDFTKVPRKMHKDGIVFMARCEHIYSFIYLLVSMQLSEMSPMSFSFGMFVWNIWKI